MLDLPDARGLSLRLLSVYSLLTTQLRDTHHFKAEVRNKVTADLRLNF